MATTNSQSTLVGLFKEVYDKKVHELWPDIAKLQAEIPFEEAARTGNHFNCPVDLVLEHGFTCAAAGANPTLIAASSGQMQNAQVQGQQLIGRSLVTYDAIANSVGDKAAFKSATSAVVKRLTGSGVKRLEIALLHGQQGIGTVNANPASGDSRAVVISAASWSPGIWAGEVGATLDIYSGATKQNAVGPLTVVSIDTTTRTVTISGFTANSLNATDITGFNLFFETASPTTEMAGLDVITSLSPSSSSLFGINPATYDLWCSNQYNVSGSLTFAKLQAASSLAASYGAYGRSVVVVSPAQFESLNTDIAALRMYDTSYKKNEGENGVKSITFYNQTGILEVMPHPFQKNGIAHMFMPDDCSRVGGQDLGFITRKGAEEVLILESATTAASEMRIFSTQALLLRAPRRAVRLYGIS